MLTTAINGAFVGIWHFIWWIAAGKRNRATLWIHCNLVLRISAFKTLSKAGPAEYFHRLVVTVAPWNFALTLLAAESGCNKGSCWSERKVTEVLIAQGYFAFLKASLPAGIIQTWRTFFFVLYLVSSGWGFHHSGTSLVLAWTICLIFSVHIAFGPGNLAFTAETKLSRLLLLRKTCKVKLAWNDNYPLNSKVMSARDGFQCNIVALEVVTVQQRGQLSMKRLCRGNTV